MMLAAGRPGRVAGLLVASALLVHVATGASLLHDHARGHDTHAGAAAATGPHLDPCAGDGSACAVSEPEPSGLELLLGLGLLLVSAPRRPGRQRGVLRSRPTARGEPFLHERDPVVLLI